jgi:hypothetical protein
MPAHPLRAPDAMKFDLDLACLPYQGWEIRSRLTQVSVGSTVAAGAEIFVGDICKCSIMSSRQFASRAEAISAIERKATLWIDDNHRRTA